MIRSLPHKKLLASSTFLFLFGVCFGLQPYYRDMAYFEFWLVIFGYLPIVGIGFTWSISGLSDNVKLFFIITSLFYCVLHYIFISDFIELEFNDIDTKELILPAVGAIGTLTILKILTKELNLNGVDFAIAFVLGALTFIPRVINNSVAGILLSVYLWQLLVGHFYKYLKTRTLIDNAIQGA